MLLFYIDIYIYCFISNVYIYIYIYIHMSIYRQSARNGTQMERKPLERTLNTTKKVPCNAV